MISFILLILLRVLPSAETPVSYKKEPLKIALDTINFWHILIDHETVLKAVHYTAEEDLIINVNESNIPKIILFDYQTDHGFEHGVYKLIQIYNRENEHLEEIEIINRRYDTRSIIPLGNLLKEHEYLILKCNFFFSEEKLNPIKNSTHWRSRIEVQDDGTAFVICHIRLSRT